MLSVIIPVGINTDRKPYIRPIIEKYRDNETEIPCEIIISEIGPEPLFNDIDCDKYIYQEGITFSRSKAINIGMVKAEFEYCAITDSDILPEFDVKHKLLGLLCEYDALFPGRFIYTNITPHDITIVDGRYVIGKYKVIRETTHHFGAFFAIRKSSFMSIGGMCEQFSQYGYEDDDIGYRCLKLLRTYNERTIRFLHLSHPVNVSGIRNNCRIYNEIRKLEDHVLLGMLLNDLDKYL